MNLLIINSKIKINPDHITKVEEFLNERSELVVTIYLLDMNKPIVLEDDEAKKISNYLSRFSNNIYT